MIVKGYLISSSSNPCAIESMWLQGNQHTSGPALKCLLYMIFARSGFPTTPAHALKPSEFLIRSLSFLLAVAVMAKIGIFEKLAHNTTNFP